MQSKVILVTDLILVIVPTVIFYFGSFTDPSGKWTGTVLVIPVSGGNTKNCRV